MLTLLRFLWTLFMMYMLANCSRAMYLLSREKNPWIVPFSWRSLLFGYPWLSRKERVRMYWNEMPPYQQEIEQQYMDDDNET